MLCSSALEQRNKKNKSINQHIDTAISITKAIIKSRKTTNSNSPQLNMDTLPKAIIGDIASYLPRKDYISFLTANRSIYIGCNDPNTLKYLNLMSTTDYTCMNISKYRGLKHLKVQLNLLPCILNHDALNSLTELTLDGMVKGNIDLDPLLSQNFINFNNIKHLSLHNCPKVTQDNFVQFLALFLNIEYLEHFRV